MLTKRRATINDLYAVPDNRKAELVNGEIVLLGRLHGVPTPANAMLQRLARQLSMDHQPPGAVPATWILGRLDEAR